MGVIRLIILFAILQGAIFYAILAEYTPPTSPTISRAPTDAQLGSVLATATDSATITAPAHLMRPYSDNIQVNTILTTLQAIVTDTRTNIIQTATLSDMQILQAYLNQMEKSATNLLQTAPTGARVDQLIGAGIRADITP